MLQQASGGPYSHTAALGPELAAPSGTEAERVQWMQWARRSVGKRKEQWNIATMRVSRTEAGKRSVGNRKERLRDYAGFP